MTKSLDKVLSNGCGTVLVVLASWCGACKRAMPMWMKQLKKKNQKNIVLLDNEQLPNTSLNGSLNITHFPSTFEIPAGGSPTLLENPQNLESIDTLVNSSGPASKEAPPPTVITASDFVNRNNSPKSFESLSTENTLSPRNTLSTENTLSPESEPMNKNASFPNTLSQKSPFMTPQGFTPSMGTVKKGGRRTRVKARRGTRRSTKRRH